MKPFNYYLLLLWVGWLFGCSNVPSGNESPEQQLMDIPLCNDIGRGLFIGQADLEPGFLTDIQKINTNSEMAADFSGMKKIKGGVFEMGGDKFEGFADLPPTALPQSDELPKHPVRVNDFWIDEHEVTNAEFRAFVQATGYITIAERPIDWESIKKQLPPGTPKPPDEALLPGSLVFQYAPKGASRYQLANWWSFVNGANWKNPKGEGSTIEGKDDHPVVQVCWYDAMAYAKWAGKRLPTEAEFEYAARGGRVNEVYPWGNEKTEGKVHYANHLQGDFPYFNSKADGYEYTAPAGSFPANGYGLYDMAGNVWEWTSDWYQAGYYATLVNHGIADNPCGPEVGIEPYDPFGKKKVIRGGSFLCHDNWCSGYRNARRMRDSPDTGMEHTGFRCVRDVSNDN
ncbi:MAG: formylglycine-generating enzyme family protein [Bacteroidota bacterium]